MKRTEQWEEVVYYFPQPPLPCGRAEGTSLGDARSRGLHCLRFSSGWGSWGGCLWEHCRSGQNKKMPCVQPGVAIPLSSEPPYGFHNKGGLLAVTLQNPSVAGQPTEVTQTHNAG